MTAGLGGKEKSEKGRVELSRSAKSGGSRCSRASRGRGLGWETETWMRVVRGLTGGGGIKSRVTVYTRL